MNVFTSALVSLSVSTAVENLTQFKKNENRLKKLLKKKTAKNPELRDYLEIVDNVSKTDIDIIDVFIRSGLKKGEEGTLCKYSELLNKKLLLEIEGEKRKSPEVSINILHNTHGAMNKKLNELYEKNIFLLLKMTKL
ncbi:hypothetical protein [Lactococcus formosensis]|uniref:hypothetical protein n=1 Tax=Lactococcus formosensis TaxID=1281486 RepID=UPI002892277C|nr:hypothetical protein [Lactococcus formosensis]MDT2725671.1 hypothetical protein [Lactococcus formosensis]